MSTHQKFRRQPLPTHSRPRRRGALLALLIGLALPVAHIDANAGASSAKARRLAQAGTTSPAATRPAGVTPDDARMLDARDAFQRRDQARLATLKQGLSGQRHPLAAWVDYWELNLRLGEVGQEELDAFYARWPGSYVEDRLRNDWLLELGRRRDWRNFAVEQPRFRMNDDREVTCYGLIVRHLLGEDVRQSARSAWLAQREADDGCLTLAQTLVATGVFTPTDLWARGRLAAEYGRPKVMRQVLDLLAEMPAGVVTSTSGLPRAASAISLPEAAGGSAGDVPVGGAVMAVATPPGGASAVSAAVGGNNSGPGAVAMAGPLAGLSPASLASELFEQPQRLLTRRAEGLTRQSGGAELIGLALARVAVSDPTLAAGLLESRWQPELRIETAAWCWSAIARQAAQKFQPEAEAWFRRADDLGKAAVPAFAWSDDALAWRLRAALRATDPQRWHRVLEAATHMSPVEQLDPAWVYWKARALLAIADPGPTGDGLRIAGQLLLERISGQLNFYGQMANEQLGRHQPLPVPPAPSTVAERMRVAGHPGLARALAMMAAGLADEGRREWNFSMRDLGDRELLAAARLACEREVWDRCIAAADRTRGEVDMALRYPQPFRAELLAAIGDTDLDPALVYGLIRQESRFATTARSGAGAAGLMQVITPTARHVAKQMGIKFHPDMLNERNTNLRIGTTYLRMVLDDFGGSQALALAAYNAGPSRSRRWREGPPLEVAAWAEMIPFTETRDYVKKVLSNASYYSALMSEQPAASLRPRLAPAVAPRPPDAPAENLDLP
ncbi:MAG: lytic transglycosylase domain-containing protein [Burkholderiales bacterium]|nr:lytic transglycosylase domain-containing protein [Burkholderiales bacterium]